MQQYTPLSKDKHLEQVESASIERVALVRLTEREKDIFLQEVQTNPSQQMNDLHQELALHVSMRTHFNVHYEVAI